MRSKPSTGANSSPAGGGTKRSFEKNIFVLAVCVVVMVFTVGKDLFVDDSSSAATHSPSVERREDEGQITRRSKEDEVGRRTLEPFEPFAPFNPMTAAATPPETSRPAADAILQSSNEDTTMSVSTLSPPLLSPINSGGPSTCKRNVSGPPDLGPETELEEIVKEDVNIDGVNTEIQEDPRGHNFISELKWRGNCWYTVTNFCVVDGQFTLYHDPKNNKSWSAKMRMCNEFSMHSPSIQLKYYSEPLPETLPGPVLTKTKAWMWQTWCQDLYHMTLSMMPSYHTLKQLGPHPDVYIRIAKGIRKHKSQHCRVKLGNPSNFSLVRNKKWNDHQFPFAGNPYWPFYRLMTPDPHRIFPMYKGATKKRVCYKNGIVDKTYLKHLNGFQAREYVEAQKTNLGVVNGEKRRCGKYRLTLIDRRGKTRRLSNTEDIMALTKRLGYDSKAVRLEHLPIKCQVELMTETDVLLGVHGNGLTWLQFLETGSVVIEMVNVWYTPYTLLLGHKHLHTSMKNNMDFKKNGEYVPFPANLTELEGLLVQAKNHLDSTSCPDDGGKMPDVTPSPLRLENLYKDCAPHC